MSRRPIFLSSDNPGGISIGKICLFLSEELQATITALEAVGGKPSRGIILHLKMINALLVRAHRTAGRLSITLDARRLENNPHVPRLPDMGGLS